MSYLVSLPRLRPGKPTSRTALRLRHTSQANDAETYHCRASASLESTAMAKRDAIIAGAAAGAVAAGAVWAALAWGRRRQCRCGGAGAADADSLPDSLQFPTVTGPGLVGEVKDIAAPYIVVTMRDLWSIVGKKLQGPNMLDWAGDAAVTAGAADGETARPYLVHSLDQAELEKDARVLNFRRKVGCIVGVGGGQAIDVAKWLAWRLGVDLFQVPTALSVDAAWGHRAAVRIDGIVRYVGYAVPRCVYVDTDLVCGAPRMLTVSGVGDVLCYHTAHHDWRLATERGKAGDWPYDARIAAQARAVLDALVRSLDDVMEASPKGVAALVAALKYGGAAYHAHGWNPRPVEGVEHLFFYCLEARTGKKFIHGQVVMLGILLGSLLQGNRPEWVASVVRRLRVDVRPEAMGVTWDDVDGALRALDAFTTKEGHMYSVANATPVTDEFLGEARALVASAVQFD